jgi:hypothetical protein
MLLLLPLPLLPSLLSQLPLNKFALALPSLLLPPNSRPHPHQPPPLRSLMFLCNRPLLSKPTRLLLLLLNRLGQLLLPLLRPLLLPPPSSTALPSSKLLHLHPYSARHPALLLGRLTALAIKTKRIFHLLYVLYLYLS